MRQSFPVSEVVIALAIGLTIAGLISPAMASAQDEGLERFRVPSLPGSSVSAYPSVERLRDGRLLCVYSGETGGESRKFVLAATTSEDHGRTWSAPVVLLDSDGGNDYDPSIIVIGERVIVTATTTPTAGRGITTSSTIAVRSDDSAVSWSEPYEIPTGRHYTSGKVNNGIVLADGSALLGFTWEKTLDSGRTSRLATEGEMDEVNAVLLSYDEGRTWASSESCELRTRRPRSATNAINGVCEPALVECADGSVFMLSRTGLDRLYASRSVDGGRSWSPPTPTPLVSHNSPAAVCRIADGRSGVVAVWNNSPEHRWPLSAAISLDNCKTWSPPRDLTLTVGHEASYPGCTQAADGKLVVVYQQTHPGGREILGARFDPAWLVESVGAPGVQGPSERPRPSEQLSVAAPRTVGRFDSMPKPAMLPTGRLAAYFIDHEGPGLSETPQQQSLYVRYRDDGAEDWTPPETLAELPSAEGGFGYFIVMVDQQGEVHLFLLCDAGTGAVRPNPNATPVVQPLPRQRLDVWHMKSRGGRSAWGPPQRIWEGRAGDLQGVTQLADGRIVLPVSYFVSRSWSDRGDGADAFTYSGQFDTTVLYSDDDGDTWQTSPSVLRTATPDLASYGAIEPVVQQLADGRVWMLLRTQLGRLYESYSPDGAVWTPPRPTHITSSDSPAAILRAPDESLLMIWNNCQRHPYANGSRHVLHAAISKDEGATWAGYREIARDPYRNSPPPPTGDHGVSYPFATVGPDGDVYYSLWVQSGNGRSLERFSPEWLLALHAAEDFSEGLDQWSTFGTRGVSLVDQSDGPSGRALRIQKADPEWPSAAIWNFPMLNQGEMKLRLRFDPGAPCLGLALSDHFSPPSDDQAFLESLYHLKIGVGEDADLQVPAEVWLECALRWDSSRGTCRVAIDDDARLVLKQQRVGQSGPSYLRLTADSLEAAESGVQLDSVVVSQY